MKPKQAGLPDDFGGGLDPEERLWSAVVVRLLADLGSNVGAETREDAAAALESDTFDCIAAHAGLDPAPLRAFGLRVLSGRGSFTGRRRGAPPARPGTDEGEAGP